MAKKEYYFNSGYKARTVSGKRKYEHVEVAESMLGRPLAEGQCVHHKDCIKTNNNPDNILVFASNRDHVRFHRNGLNEELLISCSDGTFKCKSIEYSHTCAYCAKQFVDHRFKSRYCSRACVNLSQQKVERPTTEELVKQLKESNFAKVSEEYQVSDNTLRKWLKKAGIDPKTLQPIR